MINTKISRIPDDLIVYPAVYICSIIFKYRFCKIQIVTARNAKQQYCCFISNELITVKQSTSDFRFCAVKADTGQKLQCLSKSGISPLPDIVSLPFVSSSTQLIPLPTVPSAAFTVTTAAMHNINKSKKQMNIFPVFFD